jgi:hypothetical protein
VPPSFALSRRSLPLFDQNRKSRFRTDQIPLPSFYDSSKRYLCWYFARMMERRSYSDLKHVYSWGDQRARHHILPRRHLLPFNGSAIDFDEPVVVIVTDRWKISRCRQNLVADYSVFGRPAADRQKHCE